jgi:hypothetical protein
MIKAEFFDELDRITTADNANYIVCIVTDSNGLETERKTIRLRFDKNEFHTRSLVEHHWENAVSLQKIIDNLWMMYHSTNNDESKMDIIDKLLLSYEKLDLIIERIESREHRRRRFE